MARKELEKEESTQKRRKRGGRALRRPELPREIWAKVAGLAKENDLLAFALTCKNFRDIQKSLTRRTRSSFKCFKCLNVSRSWVKWVFSLASALREGETTELNEDGKRIVAYLTCHSAFRGCLDLLKWIDSRLSHRSKKDIYRPLCHAAAGGGQLDVLKLRTMS